MQWLVIISTVFLTLNVPFISCTASCLLTYSYLDLGKFSKGSCSADLHLGPLSSSMDVSLMERMTLQVMEVVSMLLDIETNPGPVYRMYLVGLKVSLQMSEWCFKAAGGQYHGLSQNIFQLAFIV